MSVKKILLSICFLCLASGMTYASHKIGHSPGEGGGCYSGGKENTSGKAQCPITIRKVSDLGFQNVVAGFTQSVITFPSDTTAAVFEINGVPCSRIFVQVVENSVEMLANGTSTSDTITARNFTLGGSLTGSGTAVTNCTTGDVLNVRIGGTASVSASNFAPSYTGTPTIRVLYY